MISGSVPSDQNLLINIINTMIATSDQKKRNYQYNQHNGLTPVVPEISRDPATQDQTVLLRLLKDDFKNSPRISPNSQDYN